MIKITQLKLPIHHTREDLEHKIQKTLKLTKGQEFTYRIQKRSLDARYQPELFYVYTLAVYMKQEKDVVQKVHIPSVSFREEKQYTFPEHGTQKLRHRPIIVGAGPAGLFCAYCLTLEGMKPIVLERGKPVEQRTEDVRHFWETGILQPDSNVQFGEGGAGTFSDGKLNTAVKDAFLRNDFVLDTFIQYGAPEQIRYDAKPHIGTDILSKVICNMRNDMIAKGCTFYFQTQATDFVIEQQQLRQILCGLQNFETDICVLALGHSARDTFETLKKHQIPMEVKNFAVGFRVEHPQRMIDEAMYGRQTTPLPAAPYKVTSNFANGRGVYSFCMCPGGYVVNASSGEGELAVNGMSYSGRNSANANSAIIVSVTPQDYGADDVLAGVRYQKKLEQHAFCLGDGKIPQQLYGDYIANRTSTGYGDYASVTKGASSFSNLRGLFSEDMEHSFCAGMEHFGKIIPGFDRKDAILSGVESRTSSPVRISRNEFFESEIQGIYPCGEGAGYAGGIMSAAMDGIKVAEAIIRKYQRMI